MTKYLVAALVVLLLLYWALGLLSYFDPLAGCRIRIEVDLLKGDRASIRRAITLVKREDPLGYRVLCRFVDRVVEERCNAADSRIDPSLAQQGWEAPGCYLKGSRVVYLRPEVTASEAVIRKRAEALVKYAAYSRDFWLQRGGR